MDVWSATALEFEEPEHTDCRHLATQSDEKRVEIALHVLAIIGKLSGIGQGQHRGKHNISVASDERQALPRSTGEHLDICSPRVDTSARNATTHYDHILPVDLDASHRQDGPRVGCHSHTTLPGDTRRSTARALRYGTSDKPIGGVTVPTICSSHRASSARRASRPVGIATTPIH